MISKDPRNSSTQFLGMPNCFSLAMVLVTLLQGILYSVSAAGMRQNLPVTTQSFFSKLASDWMEWKFASASIHLFTLKFYILL